ncbi:DUF2087 domain-containing protein [Sinomonas terrae]|uniref:DUF2087 domain-containing protein n=1 Tax=Sinomonas terrae TaxID=2908838 RepID=A0ABS9U4R3_9MICC|nr:DUF2087 domain-containing protein [Sinomonas terrae]MCH6471678.1 DUF2087 domain-containing protein [Sinomonas terrae]
MQPQLIQFLAALANGRSRARFAEIVGGGDDGVAADERQDRLLSGAGVLKELPDGRVAVDDGALRALLDGARAALPEKPRGKLEQLPRQHRLRLEVLRGLGTELLGADEEVSEVEFNARLADRVDDVPGVRRALVDEGVVDRKRDGSRYWRAS